MESLKKLVITEVIRVTQSMLTNAEEGRNNAIEESRYHKGAMESRYDTFKEEAQYLMLAQDIRITELSSTISVLRSVLGRPNISAEKVGMLSMIELEDEVGGIATYLILPSGGGVTFVLDEKSVTAINEASPLARTLFDKFKGDEAELIVSGKKKTFTIISIS